MGPHIPQRVVIVGAGPVGLCNARTLLDDGFDVTIVTADDGVGGVWRHTFPELRTNSPWGSFTFSGLGMPKPPGDGSTIPARMYSEYLEEFYSQFVKPRATSRFHTKVMMMEPGEVTGWDLTLESPDGARTEHFDRVVLAVGSLGKPHLPQGISTTTIPIFHSQDMSTEGVQSVLSLLPPSEDLPSTQGDAETVLVVGTGKSAIDNAVLFAKERRKVLMLGRSFKWMSAPVKPDFIGSEWLTAVMGPVRNLDSRAQWFLHRTALGGLIISTAWSVLKKKYGSLYGSNIPPPKTNIHLDMPRFSVGLTPEFADLVSSGRIALLTGADVVGADDKAVILTMADGDGSERRVRCGAIIAATGFKGSGKEFLSGELRDDLGLTRQPLRDGWRDRVKTIRKRWGSFRPTGPIEDREIDLPLVYRGIVPIGRYDERDLVVAGGSTIVYKPAVLYETESHWISSFFLNDPHLFLPSKHAALDDCHAENEWLRARYPDVDPYYLFPDGTFFSGFADLPHTRQLLRDLSLDPWRAQRSGWWSPVGWMNVGVKAGDYAGVGEERRGRLGLALALALAGGLEGGIL